MDKCLIMTTGRTGSDYLHACLDDIDGVMTLCGKFDYHQFFNGPSEKIDKEKWLCSLESILASHLESSSAECGLAVET